MLKLYEITFKDRCKGCERFIDKTYQYSSGLNEDGKISVKCIFCGRYHNQDNFECKLLDREPTDFYIDAVTICNASEEPHESICNTENKKMYSQEQVDKIINECSKSLLIMQEKLIESETKYSELVFRVMTEKYLRNINDILDA